MMPSTSDTQDDLAAAFMAQRPRLKSIARRMLGSHWDAEDAVQEAWLRLQRTDTAAVQNLDAWLTTVIARVCVDQLRKQSGRHEDVEAEPLEDASPGPETLALRGEDVGTAMDIVLDALGPLERLAFVLHDVFGLSFDEISPIVERTPATARQLASRARRRIRDVDVAAERDQQQEAVDAFLRASRDGDFETLLQLLDPEVELRSDDEAVRLAGAHTDNGAPLLQATVRGADAVARVFGGRATAAEAVLIDGFPGAIYAANRIPRAVYLVHRARGRITRIDVVANPQLLADLDISVE